MKISTILDKIDENQLFVPAFQREFVWSRENVKQLISSLIKEYPTGTILTWETNNPPELKGEWKYTSSQGAIKLILDGQQRITSLYFLVRNKIPPYYKEDEIKKDPRGLYVKIDQNPVDLQYYKAKTMDNNPCWINISDVFQRNVRSKDVVRAMENKGIEVSRELDDLIDDNFKKIENILERDFAEQTIPVKASLKEAIDIFYIVNASGVNLTDAELALAQISGYWPEARSLFKEKLSELKKEGFTFELDFIVYILLAISHHIGSDMTKLHDSSNKSKIQNIWQIISSDTLDYVLNLLKQYCHIESRKEINYVYALIPMIAFIFKNNNRLSDVQIKQMIRWFLYSQIKERYLSQLGSKLDRDIKIIYENAEPFKVLIDEIQSERHLQIKPEDFIGKMVTNPLFNLMKMYFKSVNAVCLGTGSGLSKNIGKKYELDNDHIFPWAKLRDAGYDKSSTFKYALAQELTNRELLVASENRWRKSDTSAHEYLSEVKQRFPYALELQCIPDDEELWNIERYEDFLQKRREMLSEKLNSFIEQFNI
ncbi:MAG: DUF262 domain-containing protein [Alphaproteobacteria bacterium]|nr:DUF262 domain-containing protein [Alphaproteobacteria bacterium]